MEEENVATRLKVFMESLGITNSQFADAAGIPRPSLSQLLNGRNKKISDVIVRQIHESFPQLSVMWLLFGEGAMLNSPGDSPDNIESEGNFSGENFSNPTNSPLRNENGEEIGLEMADFVSQPPENSRVYPKKLRSGIESKIENDVQPKRKVIRITVYYDDSSYETFEPAKNN